MKLLALLALVGCDGGPTAPDRTGIQFVAGAMLTDTVMAEPVQALVVQVRDKKGVVRPGTVVRFESVLHPDDGWWDANGSVFVGPIASLDFRTAVVDSTDAQGRVSVRVRLGRRAGTGAVVVSVPEFGLQDTARYVIEPGSAARLTALPKDTAVYAGGSYALRAAAVDRFGNPRTDPITYTAGVGGITGLTGSTLSGKRIGRGYVLARANGLTDTAWVSVVPQGTLAAAGADGLYLFNLDGSDFRRLIAERVSGPKWMPSGTGLVFDQGYGGHLRLTDLAGNAKTLTQPSSAMEFALWPHPSRDGAWVYFGGYRYGDAKPWRVRVDGTDAQQVPGISSDIYSDEGHPSPSPDGSNLAYFVGGGYVVNIRVFDLSAQQVVATPAAGHAPSWSPVADLIAFIDPSKYYDSGPIRTMRSDGSGQRTITQPGNNYGFGLDWSSDGKWMVARSYTSQRIELVEVETGLTLPLGFTSEQYHPTWKP